jgi:hypothetical protein
LSRYDFNLACLGISRRINEAVNKADSNSSNAQFRGGALEKAVSKELSEKLPRRFEITTGFIGDADGPGNQIDVLVLNDTGPMILREDDCVIATPEAAEIAIEVKMRISTQQEFEEALIQLQEQTRCCPYGGIFQGLYVAQGPRQGDPGFETVSQNVLTAISRLSVLYQKPLLHVATIGPDLLIRRWDNAKSQVNGKVAGEAYHAYSMSGMAPGYFLHDFVDFVAPIGSSSEKAFFPIADGKESVRKYWIEPGGNIEEFRQDHFSEIPY